jgi:hypothetical protein
MGGEKRLSPKRSGEDKVEVEVEVEGVWVFGVSMFASVGFPKSPAGARGVNSPHERGGSGKRNLLRESESFNAAAGVC